MKREPNTEKAIRAAGGFSAVARHIGISRQAVTAWPRVPVHHTISLERLSGVPRETLRPDVYPPKETAEA